MDSRTEDVEIKAIVDKLVKTLWAHDYKINRLTRFLVFKMDPAIVVHIDLTF